MTRKTKKFLLTFMAVGAMFVGVLFVGTELKNSWPTVRWQPTDTVSVTESKLADVPKSSQQTYTPPHNIYLPEMMFLVVKDTDDLTATRCKNMTFRTVDSFSRRVNSNLVRADKKLYTLARIVYDECIDITIATFKDGL